MSPAPSEGWVHRAPRPLMGWGGVLLIVVCLLFLVVLAAIATFAMWRWANGQPIDLMGFAAVVGAVGQHHVQAVQGQVAQQVVELAFVAKQAQMGLAHHGLHEAAHHQFGQTVRYACGQTHGGRTHRVAHFAGQVFTQLENLIGLLHGRYTSIRQR